MRDTDKPTDEMVEAAARAMFNTGTGDYSWEQMVHEDQSRADIWREDARVVLVAALEASPTPPDDRAGLVESFRRAVVNDLTDRTPESAAAVEEARGWLLAPVTRTPVVCEACGTCLGCDGSC